MRINLAAAVLGTVLLAPALAHAQASLAGTVSDTSGAVLPGVTVEATSPVLIEGVRTAITDGSGRFQIVNLRPGDYTVTFTLPGFAAVVQEGVQLSGGGTTSVDVEMQVGGIEETVTVTGEAATVDVTTVTRQQVLDSDTIDALPTTRNYLALADLMPAATGDDPGVGGSMMQDVGGDLSVHGSRANDQRVTLNGLSTMTLQAGGSLGGQIPDVNSASEVAVESTAVSAELPTGGVRINFIPRDGGNTFSSSTFFTFSNGAMQGTNFTDELEAQGLGTPNEVKQNWDLNPAFGGPVLRDRLWFWFSGRVNSVENYAPIFENANAWQPDEWLYEPSDVRAVEEGDVVQTSLRLTWQATPNNKIAGTYKADRWCNCPDEGISATVSREASYDRRFPRLRQEHLEWTSVISNELLFEAVGMHLFERWGNMHLRANTGSITEAEEAVLPEMISVVEQSNGLLYRLDSEFNNTLVPNYAYRAALTWVTGTHNVKVGFNRTHGFLEDTTYNFQPFQYRFNNGVPNRITMFATPYTAESYLDNDLGVFAQDSITIDRATVNLAVRWDSFQSSFPAQQIGPAPLVPGRNLSFPAQDNLDWNDITYRTGLVYDLTGNGRTALKLTANKYLEGQTLNGLGNAPNPVNTLVNETTRSWDDADGDFVPDCDILVGAANGECGAIADANFGTAVPGAQFDEDLLTGFNHRESNWEFSAGIQQELMRGVSVDVGWFRRVWQNLQVTDNLALGPDDFDYFDMVVPVDPALPDGGGYVLEDIPALSPDAFGRAQDNYNTLASDYGEQTEHWNGVDVTMNARLQNGLTLSGGVSTGRASFNDCEIVSQVPETLETNPVGPEGTAWQPVGFCDRQEPWLTNVKAFGVYTIPGVEVQLSGTFKSTPGAAVAPEFVATNAYLAENSTLGRPLAGGANNITVRLAEPGTERLERRNQVDLRVGKVLRAGGTRTVVSLDLYNAFNSNVVTDANRRYASYLAPTEILNARLAKISVAFDF